ncbi:uncharacterized protein [Lepeophtheirus salmonis]|uniref:uncharacterized protein n=1 Tax=Lepeophtheirus salmonis TaxID=72036 RepID=UPI001AE7BCDE|nr:sex determination protein fruitless-like [Lepeophtheirus salmonis]XP_040576333.1 sex determination protein fruitless-like [Lepeophtheirus salmonis]
MGSSEMICLHSNDFESNLKSGFSQLRNDEDFFDVTLTCGSKHIKAHKMILSAYSSFFRSLIKSVPHTHPLLYMRGINFNHLESILSFMYNGEVYIKPHELDQFLSIAEELKVNGLMQHQSFNGANTLKRSLSSTDDTPVHEVKSESSSPLHLPDKRILIQNTVSTPITKVDEDSLIEDITTNRSNSMKEEPSNLDFQEPDDDQKTYDTSFQPECIENQNQETDPLALRYEVFDAKILKHVSDRDGNKMCSCLKCCFTCHCKRNVKKHIKGRHLFTGGISCEKCKVQFKSKQSLLKHNVTVHTFDPVI